MVKAVIPIPDDGPTELQRFQEYLLKPEADKAQYVEFCLYYLATEKKDIRAILAYLEVYNPSRYGKGASDDDWNTIKLDILAHLAQQLPG